MKIDKKRGAIVKSKRFSPLKGLVDVGLDRNGKRKDIDGTEVDTLSEISRFVLEKKEAIEREMDYEIEEDNRDDAIREKMKKEKEEMEEMEEKEEEKIDLLFQQAEYIRKPIVTAIKEIPKVEFPEKTAVSNLDDVSKPIVEAVKGQVFPDNKEVLAEISQNSAEVLKAIQSKDHKDIVDAIKKTPNYGIMLEEIKNKIQPTDIQPLIEAIKNIPQFELPEGVFEKGRLKVAVDKIGGGGGGGVPQSVIDNLASIKDNTADIDTTGLSTEAKQDTMIDNQGLLLEQMEMNYITRVAYNSGDSSIIYVGRAVVGSSPVNAVWQIYKYDSNASQLAEMASSGQFNQVWNNRESGTYA